MTFDEFVAVRLTALVRYAAVLVGDRDLAQDVVQEALVRAHSRWARIEEPEAYEGDLLSCVATLPRRLSSGTDIG